ncbi:abnormal spindle-like microcephaly-associated protein isoform X2 [Betta splendens]|uniref:Abnormal spindle-like microcephaly-associated protein isoform X2 n=1 Tax=Betta splendens TaxID=158456 RepID=A0A6P7M4Z2_BETSP|nr:abnormal spindle-like microcephaly-associated protein isoform X2 [Betta splendens]
MAEIETSTRRGFLGFSPVRRDDANKENNVPVLSLTMFSKAPFVSLGTVKLGTSKSAVLRIENPTEDSEAEVIVEKVPSSKGFSVDRRTFNVQPQGSFSLTITWTPTDEGGIRELISFSANGVLKHQAVLLGRAEAPKKKKKSLWDTIKNKREGETVAAPRSKKSEPSMKMSVNKTFQVSRKQQYKRDKPRSPLASLNDGKAARERSLTKHSPAGEHPWKSLDMSDQENISHTHKSSPLVLLNPTAKMMDSSSASANPGFFAENKDLSKVLNRTLSPIGTPERFKRLMPHIQSESPAPASLKSESNFDSLLSETSVPSLKDALALIDSDLCHINTSPQSTSSACEFSDSLESKSGNHDVFKALPNSPELVESNEPRLTFFVSKKVSVSEVVSVAECDTAVEGVKKAPFTSATVVKGKAPVEPNCASERKIRKSRRRLLEKTLEVTDGDRQRESGPRTPRLPVIDLDSGDAKRRNSEASGSWSNNSSQVLEFTSSSPTPRLSSSPTPVTFPITSPPSTAPSTFLFSCTSPPPALPDPTTLNPSAPSHPASPPHRHRSSSCNGYEQAPTACAPLSVQEDLFPVVANSKKRKSEEFSKRDAKVGGVEKTDRVKRSRVVSVKTEPRRSVQERRSVSQRQQLRAAGSVRSTTTSSLKSSRAAVPAHTKQPGSKLTSRGASSLKAAKVVAVAQSKLTFVKPAQTAIPRHPMPFAAQNMFYDERWIEKQERGFTWWINYVLTPDDFKVNTEVANVNAVSLAMGSAHFSVPKAPTKEEMSFSTYTARRKLNRLRRSACQLFTSEAMVKAIQRLELEVEAKRLLVRKDRHLWKDIGERKKVLNWLLSYNPLWLRIGLETIYGELISLESNSDALGLAVFILQRLLWNPDIAAAFRHAKVPHLYRDGHEEALSRFTLKKLLLLVCFLDKAKESRLIEHDPCLFCVDAEFKTSKDLLLAFSRDFLSGEGILPRHLGYLGLPVSHVQTPLDEFSFAVKNLAVDLKCGIRLVRVMELLVQDWKLSSKLRLPAISRLQKVHNVDVALQVLRSKGVDLKDEHGSTIDSRDVVDGHREKTLSLLWKIIFAFHVEVILEKDQLWEEICFLKRTLKTKRRLVSLRADRGLQPSPVQNWSPYEHSSTKITLLMDWVRSVCDFYNLKVENFTVAFSDGRVLCYLIHHYHPSLLPEEAISASTTQTVECSTRGRLELNCSASDSDSSFDLSPTGLNGPDSPSVQFKQLLENEKNNLRLVNTAVSFLGGVPAMINPADMSNTIPNEKVVMSYLSFLCARLLDLRNETRAARLIQGAWRKYRLKKDLQLYKERNMAAMKIQALVRSFLLKRRTQRRNRAAVVIQAVWRGSAARNRLRLQREAQCVALQHKAATVIQARWRGFSDLRAYQRLRYYTIVVQAQWRMRVAAKAYGRIRWAAIVIQKHSRARARARLDRERYLHLKTAVVKIQRGYRRWKAHKMERANGAARVIQVTFKKWYKRKMTTRSSAAVTIQSWYRMQRCVHRYRKAQKSAVLLQAWYRGLVQRRCLQTLKLQHRAATVIQSAFRGRAVRKQAAKTRRAALTIQRWFRASIQRDMDRQAFVRMRRAAVTIQASYRGKVAREWLMKRHQAATVIQAAFRKYLTHRRYLVLRKSAVLIQQKYRATVLAHKTRKDYDSLKKAALSVQAHWRGKAARKRLEQQHRCAAVIQAHYRRHKAQAEYRSRKAAAIVLQRQYRAYVAGKGMRRAYLQTRAACVALQAGFRGMRVRTEIRQKHQAATRIQASLRMVLCRKRYVLLRSASVIIQSRYRALVLCRAQQTEYRALKQAAIRIQAVHRGFKAREELRKRHDAARAIQAQFRMHRTRVAFLAAKCAAVIFQERYRAKMLRDQQLQSYKAMKSAAVTLQAAYRGHRARRTIMQMHRAATVIQRVFRTYTDRSRFLAVRKAALVCQQRCRAVILGRKARLDYRWKRKAVVCLQAAFRAHKVRKQLRVQHVAALTVQAHFRTYRQRTYYKRLRWAAVVLQRRYRATNAMRAEMSALKAKRGAAVVLQAAFRGKRSRHILKQKHQAASVIQRAYKAHSERRQYLTLKSAVLTLQLRWRANAAAKEQRRRHQNTRRAAVVLQAAFRGWKVRRDAGHQHQAATVIQSAFRKHREEVKFQAMRLAAIIIQRSYRSLVLQRREREHFLRQRRSAVVLQAAFRGHRVRASVAEMHRAAAVIQANYRRHKEQLSFRRRRWAACVLQHRFRAQRQMNLELQRYQEVRKAAVVLQAACRGMRSRRSVHQSHRAAVVLQRAYRAHCERRGYVALKASILNIQRRYRASAAAKQQMQKYQDMRRAAVVLQAAFRGWKVRRDAGHQHRAATVIQSAFRKHREEVKFQAMRLAAIIIQRSYRSLVLQRREREHFLRQKRSAVVLQAAFRGHRVRASVAEMHRAAAVIQANYRRHKEQLSFRRRRWAACVLQHRFRAQRQMNLELQRYQEVRKAAVSLQAAFRGMESRRVLKHSHRAARVIQRAYRAHSQHEQYLKLKWCVVAIQQKYRATVAAKAERGRYLELRRSTVVLQAACRGRQVRREVACRHQAATVIQAAFRKHRVEVRYWAMRLSAVVIQRRYRSCVLQRRERQTFLRIKRSAAVLQAACRGWRLRRDARRREQAAVAIQSWWRCSVQRRIFLNKREAAVTLQRRVRAEQLGAAQRKDYTRLRRAVVTLQAHCRAWMGRRQALEAARAERRLHFTSAAFHHLNAIKIQRALRAHWALESAKRQIHSVVTIQRWFRAKQQRRCYQEDRRRVVKVQRAVRRWLACRHKAASVIQQAARRFLHLRRQERIQQGIVKAQALWRGHRSRRLNDNPKVVKLRRRFRQVSASVREEDKLCNKTSSALDYLLRYKQFSYILEALKNLDAATRLSPECCVRLVESGATDVIFTLIRCCNRSVPCMDVITFSIQILLNLSKYHKTIEAVYSVENSVETLLELLQRYREKAGDKVAERGGSIFTKACFLLALLLQDKHRAAEVMKMPKALDRIRSIYRLTARKHKMDAERTVVRQKMNASLNGSYFVPVTPRKPRPAPKFAPDWVLGKDKLKDIVDPLGAIQMVADTLSIML